MITINNSDPNYAIASFTFAVKKLNILIADNTKKLLQEVMNEGKPNLILDLENIQYIDSSGLATLISLLNYAKNHNITFILCNVSESNMELIKVTKLSDVFKIYSNKEGAIASCKK